MTSLETLIKDENNILSFHLMKIEKGRKKICTCKPPHYELDVRNRVVNCLDCGATLDAFDALLSVSEHMDEYRNYQEQALKRSKLYSELADKEFKRYLKNKAFKEMNSKYQNGMYPHCPKCREAFDPANIVQWTYKDYVLDDSTKEGSVEI